MEKRFAVLAALALIGAFGEPSPIYSQSPPAREASTIACGIAVDADGKPVAEAQILCCPHKAEHAEGVRIKPITTDREGRFTITFPGPLTPGTRSPPGMIWCLAREYREVMLPEWYAEEPFRVALSRPSAVRVKVVGPQGNPIQGATVLAYGNARIKAFAPPVVKATQAMNDAAPADNDGPPIAGTTNAEGIVAIPWLDRDEVHDIEVQSKQYGRQQFHFNYGVPADEERLELLPAARIRGRVIAETPEAVRGVVIKFRTMWLPFTECLATVTTDNNGAFSIPAIGRGSPFAEVTKVPDARYRAPPVYCPRFEPGETYDFTIQLRRAVQVHVTVREKGTSKPIAKARVTCQLRFPSDNDYDSLCKNGMTDEQGRAQIDGMPCDALLYVGEDRSVEVPATFCWGPQRVAIPSGKDRVELPPVEMTMFRGRVVDQNGKPIADARVEYEGVESARNVFSNDAVFGSDEAGVFQIWIDPERRCELKAFADKYLPASLDVETAKLAKPEFPDLVVRTKRAEPAKRPRLTGHVVDRQGKPVAGAKVFAVARQLKQRPNYYHADEGLREASSQSVVTDATGAFELTDVPDAKVPLFVESVGFRFYGQWLDKGVDDVTVTLARSDEPPRRQLKAGPPLVSREDRLAVSRRLLDQSLLPFLVSAHPDMSLLVQLAKALVDVDAKWARRLINGERVKSQLFVALVRKELGQPSDPLQVLLQERCGKTPGTAKDRFAVTLNAFEDTPDSARERRLTLLEQSLAHARTVKEAGPRIDCLTHVAERLLMVGETERGTVLFRECAKAAAALPDEAHIERGHFAERFAKIDLAAAVDLIRSPEMPNRDNILTMMAMVLARKDPVRAEWLLSLDPRTDASRTCARMVAVDPDRAERLAERMGKPREKAETIATLAEILASSQPKPARRLLARAFQIIEVECSLASDSPERQEILAPMAAAMLPLAEQIDPQQLDELLWRAMALRIPEFELNADDQGLRRHDELSPAEQADWRLAAFVSRYDRETAAVLTADLWDALPVEARAFMAATIVLKPAAIPDDAQQLPKGLNADELRCRLAVGLAYDDERLWKLLRSQELPSLSFHLKHLNDVDQPPVAPWRWWLVPED